MWALNSANGGAVLTRILSLSLSLSLRLLPFDNTTSTWEHTIRIDLAMSIVSLGLLIRLLSKRLVALQACGARFELGATRLPGSRRALRVPCICLYVWNRDLLGFNTAGY